MHVPVRVCAEKCHVAASLFLPSPKSVFKITLTLISKDAHLCLIVCLHAYNVSSVWCLQTTVTNTTAVFNPFLQQLCPLNHSLLNLELYSQQSEFLAATCSTFFVS